MSGSHSGEVATSCDGMGGVERLSLRLASMINHPIAQTQRWVTIHRLDTDGDREWSEVMGLLAETDDLNMTLNEDETVTLKWEMLGNSDRAPDSDAELAEDPAPF